MMRCMLCLNMAWCWSAAAFPVFFGLGTARAKLHKDASSNVASTLKLDALRRLPCTTMVCTTTPGGGEATVATECPNDTGGQNGCQHEHIGTMPLNKPLRVWHTSLTFETCGAEGGDPIEYLVAHSSVTKRQAEHT